MKYLKYLQMFLYQNFFARLAQFIERRFVQVSLNSFLLFS